LVLREKVGRDDGGDRRILGFVFWNAGGHAESIVVAVGVIVTIAFEPAFEHAKVSARLIWLG
jgi:hypothetical protein